MQELCYQVDHEKHTYLLYDLTLLDLHGEHDSIYYSAHACESAESIDLGGAGYRYFKCFC